jgi:hypothetical protein
MKWKKIGFFSVPTDKFPWMHSHAQLPTPLVIDDGLVRVFFASRNESQRSHIAYTELSIPPDAGSMRVERIATRPVLSPGPFGNFDEHGVYPSCVIFHDGLFYMYFIGWNQGVEEPLFYASIGLATSIDGINFDRDSVAPLLARSDHDPCLVTSPHVYIDNGRWRMSYVSGVKWTRNAVGRLQSHYHIKLAEGTGPRDWQRNGEVAIDFGSGETNIARSALIKGGEKPYRMWFSYVASNIGKYRIGYAESTDGSNWIREDRNAGIMLDNEHCREMVCYPAVFNLYGRHFMVYNGDRFGQAGFCVAVGEE